MTHIFQSESNVDNIAILKPVSGYELSYSIKIILTDFIELTVDSFTDFDYLSLIY